LQAKISDFGISKFLNNNLASTTVQKGTPAYQSPGIIKINKLRTIPSGK
jgi:serine/threonine protein kinase